jgi:hypothetical protein
VRWLAPCSLPRFDIARHSRLGNLRAPPFASYAWLAVAMNRTPGSRLGVSGPAQ